MLVWDIGTLDGMDTIHGFSQSIYELVKVFAVKEDLVLLEVGISVITNPFFTLRDGEVMIVRLGAFHIEEVGALSGTDRLGENLFAMVLMF